MISLQYIAGFFDGEGSVFCTAKGYVAVSITQRRPKVLYLIQAHLGYGRVLHSKAGIHFYRITRTDYLEMFLSAIQPFTLEKRDQVDLALQMVHWDRAKRKKHWALLKELKQ